MNALLVILAFSSGSDKDKFEFLYNQYKNLLMHKAYGILHDHMLAEDAVSEAMIRVYRNLDKIEDPESGRTAAFLVTIVKNVALTLLEKQKGLPSDFIEETEPDSLDLEGDVLSDIATRDIYRLVEELGEEMKGVFLLKYAYDLPHKEIGRLLGITENNVTVRLHRAKKKMADILVKEGYAGERGTN